MKMTRKDFLRLSGLSLLIAGSRKVTQAVSQQSSSAQVEVTGPQRKVRWGMVIDLHKCRTGCDACIRRCNVLHNIPHIAERAHEVKWIWTEPFKKVFPFALTAYTSILPPQAPVPMLCNHCENPPCTRVCPTKATWKREDGIVMMDWHRCIGCRYCIAACPYGSRSFNWEDPRPAIPTINPEFPTRTKGVVEKCNFCEELLAQGRLPGCVEACTNGALIFGNLADPNSEPRKLLRVRFAIQREPELGTGPSIYYLV